MSDLIRSPRSRHSRAGILLFLAISAISACDGNPFEHDATKAVIQDKGGWGPEQIFGEFDSPRMPVKIGATGQQIAFLGVFIRSTSHVRQLFGPLGIKFFGSGGPSPSGGADKWPQWVAPNVSGEASFNWSLDPEYPNHYVVRPNGNYTAGYSGVGSRKDVVYVRQLTASGLNWWSALARADLPWIFNAENSSMIAEATQVFKGEAAWVHATADLPGPITYSWMLNWESKPWTTSLVTAILSETGPAVFYVTMTGSNGSQVQRSMNVSVLCPPPADPYAIYCP